MAYNVLNNKTGKIESINDKDVSDAILSGSYSFNKNDSFNVLDSENGTPRKVNISEAYDILSNGNAIYTDKELRDIELENKYGSREVVAAGLGAAKGLSLGLSDVALTKSGVLTPEELDAIYEKNKASSIIGEVAGSIVGLGKAKAGVGLISKAAKYVPGTSAILASEVAGKKIANMLVSDSAKRLAASGVEGAIQGAAGATGETISQYARGNADLNAENILGNGFVGSLLGGGVGLALTGSGIIVPKIAKSVKDKISGIGGADDVGSAPSTGSFTYRAIKALSGLSDEEAELFLKDINTQLPKEIRDLSPKEKIRKLQESGLIKAANGEELTGHEARAIAIGSESIEKEHFQNLENFFNKELKDISDNQISDFYNIVLPVAQFSEQNLDAIKNGAFKKLTDIHDTMDIIGSEISQTSDKGFIANWDGIKNNLGNFLNTFKKESGNFKKGTDPTDLFATAWDIEKQIDKMIDFYESGYSKGMSGYSDAIVEKTASRTALYADPAKREALNTIKLFRKELDDYTKDTKIWAQYGDTTREVQEAYSRFARAKKEFDSIFTDKKTGLVNRKKLQALLSTNEKHTSKYPQEQLDIAKKIFDERIDSFKNMVSVMENVESRHGIDVLTLSDLPKFLEKAEKNPKLYDSLISNLKEKIKTITPDIEAQKIAETAISSEIKDKASKSLSALEASKEISAVFNKIKTNAKNKDSFLSLAAVTGGSYMLGLVPFSLAAPIGLLTAARKFPTELVEIIQRIKTADMPDKVSLVDKAVRGFIEKSSYYGKQQLQVLPGKDYSDREYDEKKQEIMKLLSSPQEFTEKLQEANAKNGVSDDLIPNIASKSMQAIGFLKKKAYDIGYNKLDDAFSKNKYKSSNYLVKDFFKYYDAINDPYKTIYEIKNGFIDYKKIEAVKTVYPEIFGEFKEKMLTALNDKKVEIPFGVRQNILNALGVPVSGGMSIELQNRLIQNSKILSSQAQQAEQQKSQGISKNQTRSYMTDAQRAANRGNLK